MVTLYIFMYGLLGVLGLVCLIAAIVFIKDSCIDDAADAIFISVLGLVGLPLVILMPCCIWYGLTADVDIHMQNSEGKVIEKTVKPFEFEHDGNCFRFADDSDNTYCGWEVKYNYKD